MQEHEYLKEVCTQEPSWAFGLFEVYGLGSQFTKTFGQGLHGLWLEVTLVYG